MAPMSYYTPYSTNKPKLNYTPANYTPSTNYYNVPSYATPQYQPQPSGQVLGASTGNVPQPVQQPQQAGTSWQEEQQRLAQEQAKVELENALSQYDKYAEEARAQKSSLGQDVEKFTGRLGEQFSSAEQRAGTLTKEAEETTSKAKETALSTAQDVVRKNRNVLRALGILSSSAAGEMLARPMEEYATQSADLGTQLIKRKDEVENWLSERMVEYNNAVEDLQDNYTKLVSEIDRDLRFNERDKINAVQSAQVALQSRISEIQSQAVAYQQAANEYNNNLLAQMAQVQLYQNPQANISGILSQMVQPGNYTQGSGGVGVLPYQKKKENTLSGYGQA